MKAILSSLILSLAIVVGIQAKTITGTVTDKTDGTPLAGVQVKNGNAHSVQTNAHGKYAVQAQSGDELTFSYLGYDVYTIKVGKNSVVNVKMTKTAMALEEVVVIGYGEIRKENVAGSPVRVHDGLQGRVAGVQATNSYREKRAPILIRGVAHIPANTESYASITENKFTNPLKEPLSTFAADVDGASYSNVKRFVKGGNLPPEDAVRIEEMINYFQYDLEEPQQGEPVRIKTELTHSPWNRQHQLLRISLKAKDIPKDKLPASNFVFLIDISGSMSASNKLPLVKSSLKLLVDQLRPSDKVAIVTYAGNANVALESTSGDKKMKIKEVIDALHAGGSTAGGDGLKMAYNIARKNFIQNGNNRIVMATDGDFNVGASSDQDMEKLIVKERESNVNISILGYGMGNYKDSKLETLANKGRGNYGYINDISEARKAVITEFGGTMFTVAKDVKIQVEFNPKFVQSYRLVGYENRLMAAEDFNNDNKVGGDMGVGHMVTALYEIVPVGVKSTIIGSVDPLKYQENKQAPIHNTSSELATVKFRYKDPQGDKSKLQQQAVYAAPLAWDKTSEDFKFITSVAELGMLLRNSEYKQGASFDDLIKRAKANKGIDDEGYRAEFVRLAEDAKVLMKSNDVVLK
ncbi:DUF3520 domain-containing protein [Parapedobacter sp. SGR-10]|uniref:vWA domain-containing protein n=1 Tax=Parapedobacter sp. SGR-10 TaxID=2710879 RepID=UPI0013D20701|nr:VWA domain-containing protein [Parapedobacter sp. SGR-10]NGF55039.1 DUF3520 domain-containing protein [Parapedobacter sp. SGR-10]